MIEKDPNAKTVREKRKLLFIDYWVYYFQSSQIRTIDPWDEATYQSILKRQEDVPVQVGRARKKTWWLFRNQFYWEDGSYTTEQVKALVLEMCQEQQMLRPTFSTSVSEEKPKGKTKKREPNSDEQRELVQYLWNTVDELVEPLRKGLHVMKSAPGLEEKSVRAIEEKIKNPVSVFCSDLAIVAARFGSADRDTEAVFVSGVLLDLFQVLLGLDAAAANHARNQVSTDPSLARQVLQSILSPYSDYLKDDSFLSISLLQMSDAANGTSRAEKAKAMYFRFANAIIKADGKISREEEGRLSAFKEALWASSPAIATPDTATQVAAGQEPSEQAPSRKLEEVLEELDVLVGLEMVKKDVTELVNLLKVQQIRKTKGLKMAPMSLHLVFYGNPGTGKTTVARLLAQIYRALGILSKGHLVETDRSGLVAGYVGQTALKVNEIVNGALGGILFIDEAYSLQAKTGGDYGEEAIATLLKQMEDHRDDLIVIVAGYTDKMEQFLASNPGLRSRFNKYLKFEDYTPAQLVAIFETFCKKSSYKLSQQAQEKLELIFKAAYDNRDETFGNARLSRNLFESAISNQASRIIALTDTSIRTLSAIEAVDIPTEGNDNVMIIRV